MYCSVRRFVSFALHIDGLVYFDDQLLRSYCAAKFFQTLSPLEYPNIFETQYSY